MNAPDWLEVQEKQRRIRAMLAGSGGRAAVLGRRDNFAWFTGGGDSGVVRSSNLGAGVLVLTADSTRLVAYTMDGERILEEEAPGLGIEPVFIRWHEGTLASRAEDLIRGSAAISDFPLAGATCEPARITALHYPLSARELDRCCALGASIGEVLFDVALQTTPGMRECEVAARLLIECVRRDMECEVLLVGSDERIGKFRHPVPSEKPVDRLLLLHVAARRWGLHCNVSRMVWFGGRVPAEVRRRYDAACRVEAASLALCRSGTRFASILDRQKALYRDLGYPGEWELHFQGGITGYVLADAARCLDPDAVVADGQVFDWFVTITGVKVEELTTNAGGVPAVLSATSMWPLAQFDSDGFSVHLPDILVRPGGSAHGR